MGSQLKELPRKAQVWVVLVGLLGGTALVYSAATVWKAGLDGLLPFIALAGLATLFALRTPKPKGPSATGAGRFHTMVFALEDYFVVVGWLAFSPAAAALVAASGATLVSIRFISRIYGYRTGYNAAAHGLAAWLCGTIFYWAHGQSAPFVFDNSTDLVKSLLILYVTATLYQTSAILLVAFAISLAAEESLSARLRHEVWSFLGGLACATAAGANYFAFPDSPLAAGLAGFPVLGLVHVFRRFDQRRIVSLFESRELLQSSLDALSSAMAVLDASGRIVATNEAWRANQDRRRPFGNWLRVGDNYLEACEAGLGSRVYTSRAIAGGVRRVLSGVRREFSMEYGCPPGVCWQEVRVSQVDGARRLQAVIVHQEITDRFLSAARLRESEARYRRFFENDLTGDFVANRSGQITDCNPAFAEMIGYSAPEQAMRAGLRSLFPNLPRLRDSLQERGKVEYLQADIRRLDGATLNVVCNFTAERDPSGELAGIRGYLFDDTQRRKLEEALIQAQKMEAVGQLAGGMAHEFNNILTVIAGYAEFLSKELADHRSLRREAGLVLKAARKGGGLTEQLLVFSHGGPPAAKAQPLDSLVEDCAAMLRRLLGERVRLVLRLNAKGAAVRVDRGRMEQVLLNLALNARDAMPDGGQLRLRTGMESPDTAFLRVSDTGAGIPEEYAKRIFEPFFTTKAQGKGTGLGLATVSGIIRQSGGRIEVVSKPGRGTRFDIKLPATAARRTAGGSQKRRKTSPGGSETVLVVEDQRAIRELITETLGRRGYRVLSASDGAEAAGFLESSEAPVDLLLTDVVMPRMGGWELVKRLRRSGKAPMKILYISGYPETRAGLLDSSAEDFQHLQKPFTPSQLAAKVRRILDS